MSRYPEPTCEQCDLALVRFEVDVNGATIRGWCCDGCGWSWDDAPEEVNPCA